MRLFVHCVWVLPRGGGGGGGRSSILRRSSSHDCGVAVPGPAPAPGPRVCRTAQRSASSGPPSRPRVINRVIVNHIPLLPPPLPPVPHASFATTRGFATTAAAPPTSEPPSDTPKRRRRRNAAAEKASAAQATQSTPSSSGNKRERGTPPSSSPSSALSTSSSPTSAHHQKDHATATAPKKKKEKKPGRPGQANLSPAALAEAEIATWQAEDAPSLAAAEQLVHEVRQHLSYRYYPRKVFLDHLPDHVTAKDLLKTFAGLGGAGKVDAVVVLEVMRPWNRRNRTDPRLPGPRTAILQFGDKATYDRALSDDVRMFGICWQRHVFRPSRGLGRNLFLALSTGEFTIVDLCGKSLSEPPLPPSLMQEDGLEGLALLDQDFMEEEDKGVSH